MTAESHHLSKTEHEAASEACLSMIEDWAETRHCDFLDLLVAINGKIALAVRKVREREAPPKSVA